MPISNNFGVIDAADKLDVREAEKFSKFCLGIRTQKILSVQTMKNNNHIFLVSGEDSLILLQKLRHGHLVDFVGESGVHEKFSEMVVDFFFIQGGKIALDLPDIQMR